MTPKEKAKELFDKMNAIVIGNYPMIFSSSKQCALIAVEEIMKEALNRSNFYYWAEVKQEIQKL